MKSAACCPYPVDAGSGRPPSTVRLAGFARSQTGVALITVLLIVFLASVTATSLAALQQIAIRRSTVLQHQQQARLYTLAIEQWAVLVLARDSQQNETDHLHEEWANASSALPVTEGVLSAQLRDLQGCFNLNNLWQSASSASATGSEDPNSDANPYANPYANPENPSKDGKDPAKSRQDPQAAAKEGVNPPKKPSSEQSASDPAQDPEVQSGKARLNQVQYQVFQRLLSALELKPELAQAIVDWIDPDQDPIFPDGAEDSDYNVLTPAYLAANRPLSSVTELRLIKGMDQNAYDKLAPLVCALPSKTPLNVNTAPAQVLAALTEGKDPKAMEQLLKNRPAEGYKNVDEFLNAAELTVDATLKSQLSVATQHFLLQAEARVGDGRAMLYSTLYRTKNSVRVRRRSFGNQD
ncbi:MAG: type II secretion system minor pseudopilin GspK [Candidatus Competibacter sp.]